VVSHERDLHDNETKAALARAFDLAWERFIAIEGAEAATDDNRRRLATQIVELAKSGESDEDLLGEAGLITLRVLSEAARLSSQQAGAHPDGQVIAEPLRQAGDGQGPGYAPETVAAMTTALELCLDELPPRIPTETLALLSASILDAAARGEDDPERLRLHALELLKTRQ
jgi:hypothetical protein